MSAFHDLSTKTLQGKDFPFSALAGKVVLVVNTASKCGFTPQYTDLEKLNQKYKDKGLVILGFPCNDFGGQEPGTSAEIGEFCRKNYGVTFPMMSKVQTKAGEGQSEIYAYLSAATGKLPSWNFGKYLVGRDGVPVAFYGSGTKPMGEELRTAIDKALAAKPVS